MKSCELDDGLLEHLARQGLALGLPRLGVVALDHPGFEPARQAYARFLSAEKAGTMAYLANLPDGRCHPEHMLPGAQSLIMALLPYRGQAGPIARYAQSADYHTILHRRLKALSHCLVEALPAVQTLVCVDSRPVLERAAAQLAGLGFIGKHGCLIAPGLGSFVLLGGLLTTASWQGRVPPVDVQRPPWDACGSCTACLDACPTGAFDGPGDLDPRRCIAYLTLEYRGAIDPVLGQRMGERIAGCDRCQEVCPYNASPSREARVPTQVWLGPAGPSQRPLTLAELLRAGSSPYRAFVRGSPLNRVPRRAMKRNVLWALRNKGSQLEKAEVQSVQAVALGSDEELAGLAASVLQARQIALEVPSWLAADEADQADEDPSR